MTVKNNIAISDSGFIFNPNTGESFSVNPISTKILEWMKDGKSNEEIIKMILENYSIDKDTIERDLNDFSKLLESYQIIESTKD
jgi:hypothetical protein